ncbi:hypothetical protein ACFLSI_01920 [Bacteroidota bacterium]
MINKTFIKTGRPEYDLLYPKIKSFLEKNVLNTVIDNIKIRGYRTPDTRSVWIRDYSDMMRGFKYFEPDLKSTIDHFAETQADNGRIFDYFTTFPEKLPCEKENWTKYVRVPVEADVEYRFIKAAFLAWQATGNDDWMRKLLPKMEKALHYIFSNNWRFDNSTKLIKRPYTIDTWDFAYTAGKHDWLQFQINEDTYWGIFHGDNSGYYEALKKLAQIYRYFDKKELALESEIKADEIKQKLNQLCWNGSFYTHFMKLTPVEIDGVDESLQLSLSNPMNINRGITDQKMAASIIREYINRKKKTEAFAEWFSIDPPFPDGIFGDEKLVKGAYINGGIMPLVGGELAMAAFNNGFEEYGADILKRYYKMISENNETFLWYFPDGTPSSVDTSTSPEARPTDGWGSSAMLYALIEGMAGVEDKFKQLKKIKLSPRWLSADINEAEINIQYDVSESFINYKFSHKKEKINLNINCIDTEINFHVLLPPNKSIEKVLVNQNTVDFKIENIEKSKYVNFEKRVKEKSIVSILFEK